MVQHGKHSKERYSKVSIEQHITAKYSMYIVQHGTARYRTVKHGTTQYSKVQVSTEWHSMVQHSTVWNITLHYSARI
jgi:hypothetical protein